MAQQAVAGIFHQVEHPLKTLNAAKIWIRHHSAVKLPAELADATHFVLVPRWARLLYLGQVVPVHHQDKVHANFFIQLQTYSATQK